MTFDAGAAPDSPWQHVPERGPATDHRTFFKGAFEDGPSVTRACLECHPKAASEIMQTAHWNLVGDEVTVPGHDEPVRIGKRNLINNFCIGIKSNWPGCMSCHIGFGWEDESFDLTDESLVDCLVCHEQTGNYHKNPGDAGRPAADVDLLASAKSVGNPTRANCGACHFMGGGGNAVKHGDLDESLLFPSPAIDVHMGKLGFQCIDCHQAEDHLPPGRLLTVSVDDKNRLLCTNCHKGDTIHGDRRIDAHTDRVACQTCHIPLMAVKTGTKLSWDWSQAGQDLPITNEHLYLKIKGRFTWVKGARPEYAWYNGKGRRYLLGDKIDPDKVTEIAAPQGDVDDPDAKLYPFKIHRGRQVYDTQYKHFILPHVYGDKGFWTQFNWDDALRIGSEVTGLPYSGDYDFAPTEMYMPQNHMVVGKEQALQCQDCHGDAGRIDWVKLGYAGDPVARAPLDHEPIPLLDADGEMVHESGNPLSTAETCSQCHEIDTDEFVATHAYHSTVDDARLAPQRRQLMDQGPRISDDDPQQMNCFLCHLAEPNLDAWQAAKQSGNPAWAVSATLIGTGNLEADASGYRWNADNLDDDELAVISMAYPRPRHCGNCHGLVHSGDKPLLLALGSAKNWNTEQTGQVFSGQRIRLSALNLQGKDDLGRPWDVHAQRLVECRDCHYAQDTPAQLMTTPDAETATPTPDGHLRHCDSCHTEAAGHDWLPAQDKHFSALACEACHVPRVYLPARKQVDASVVNRDGNPLISYRGLAQGEPDKLGQAYIDGYRPLLVRQRDDQGADRWAPMNVVSRWFWIDEADGNEVSFDRVKLAWLDGDKYRAEIMDLFDVNADHELDRDELRLDSQEKVALISSLLTSQGVATPAISAELHGHHLHHNVALKDAERRCERCHQAASDDVFVIADYLPGTTRPHSAVGLPRSLIDEAQSRSDGGLVVKRPARVSTKTLEQIGER